MPEVRANGTRLYYEEHGAGAPILCIHGAGSSAAVWADAVGVLARHGRAIAYDRRGCFRSERPEPYATDLSQQAADAAALLDALGAAPAIVIGRSYGADTAIELALRFPDSVLALALLEGGESLTEAGRRWQAGLEERVLAAARADVDTVGETLLRAVLGDGVWEGLPDAVREMFAANGPAIVAEFRGGFLGVDLDELATIRVPTLLVTGRESPPVFADAARLLADTIPSAKAEWVEGGHLVDPASPAVLAFLSEVLAGE